MRRHLPSASPKIVALVVLVPLYTLGYLWLNERAMASTRGIDLSLPFEKHIPFVPQLPVPGTSTGNSRENARAPDDTAQVKDRARAGTGTKMRGFVSATPPRRYPRRGGAR